MPVPNTKPYSGVNVEKRDYKIICPDYALLHLGIVVFGFFCPVEMRIKLVNLRDKTNIT